MKNVLSLYSPGMAYNAFAALNLVASGGTCAHLCCRSSTRRTKTSIDIKKKKVREGGKYKSHNLSNKMVQICITLATKKKVRADTRAQISIFMKYQSPLSRSRELQIFSPVTSIEPASLVYLLNKKSTLLLFFSSCTHKSNERSTLTSLLSTARRSSIQQKSVRLNPTLKSIILSRWKRDSGNSLGACFISFSPLALIDYANTLRTS